MNKGDRFRHPDLDMPVEVTKVVPLSEWCRVYFKGFGVEGRLVLSPQTELERV
jgi:hypothetical protein